MTGPVEPPGRRPFDLAGRVALVTGAGAPDGIGFAAARLLGALGAAVAVGATTPRSADRAADLTRAGVTSAAVVADLTDPEAAVRAVAEAQSALGPLDILVNNAGMVQAGDADPDLPFLELSPQAWQATIDRNLTTAANVCRAALPDMVARGHGRVVNVSSVTGPLVSFPGSSAYSAAKAGMDGLTRALAIEVSASGVTVNSVAPGWIATGSATPHERVAGTFTPVGRPGRPEEVGALIAFLASDEASYVTGQSLVVDGGNVIQDDKSPPGASGSAPGGERGATDAPGGPDG